MKNVLGYNCIIKLFVFLSMMGGFENLLVPALRHEGM